MNAPVQLDLFEKPKKTLSGKIVIREIRKREQIKDVIKMAHAFANDTDLKNEWVDDDMVISSCLRVLHDIDRTSLNVFLAYIGEEVVGIIVGVANKPFYRVGVVAHQHLWYVMPEARSTVVPILLLRGFERWARLVGATRIVTGSINLRYSERISKILNRFGYGRVGDTYLKEI